MPTLMQSRVTDEFYTNFTLTTTETNFLQRIKYAI